MISISFRILPQIVQLRNVVHEAVVLPLPTPDHVLRIRRPEIELSVDGSVALPPRPAQVAHEAVAIEPRRRRQPACESNESIIMERP